MIEILKHGEGFPKKWKCKCPKCGCKFTAEEPDFKRVYKEWYVACPDCGYYVCRTNDCEDIEEDD